MSKDIGYHIRKIKKGQIGEISKIKEEIEELEDAIDQNARIMALVELSDLYGSIQLYLEKHFPDIKMKDLEKMSLITQRAFKNGKR